MFGGWSRCAPAGSSPPRRRLGLEILERRELMVANVLLDFGSPGTSNDFEQRLAELAVANGLPAFTTTQTESLKTTIGTGLQTAFASWEVNFISTPLGGESAEILSFGHSRASMATATDKYGQAELDWLNLIPDATSYVFPEQLVIGGLATLPSSQRLALLGNALTYFGVSYLGTAFGLQKSDAFGDPSITPESYGNTDGIQNRHYLSDAALGLNLTNFDGQVKYTFSPLSRVKLEFALGLTASPAEREPEVASQSHATPATAQALHLRPLPLSQASATDLEVASVSSEKDFYSFQATAGDLLTANVLASGIYGHEQPASFDSVLKLIGPDGVTLLATSDNIAAGVNSFGPVSGTQMIDEDSMILNYIIPTTATYYLEVTSKTQNPGFYDLLVARWERLSHPWQNASLPRDVTGDGEVVARDALRIINEINRIGSGGRRLPNPPVGAEHPIVNPTANPRDDYYYDVTGDGFVTANDALLVINFINAQASDQEGESEADTIHQSLRSNPTNSISNSEAVFFEYGWWGDQPVEQPAITSKGKRK